jgi:hypothetical protein
MGFGLWVKDQVSRPFRELKNDIFTFGNGYFLFGIFKENYDFFDQNFGADIVKSGGCTCPHKIVP